MKLMDDEYLEALWGEAGLRTWPEAVARLMRVFGDEADAFDKAEKLLDEASSFLGASAAAVGLSLVGLADLVASVLESLQRHGLWASGATLNIGLRHVLMRVRFDMRERQ